ncbi:MAG: transglutaminase domain-containing protein [Kiritimatiellae bacterium]|nr:transglutaminase domain-containing protein [Kiritimatiellia bacterium]
MNHKYTRMFIVVIWLCLVTWFIRYEAFPEYFTHSLSGYRDLFSKNILVMDSWMRILFNDSPIGYSHSSIDIDESSALHHYSIESDVQLRMKLMGELQTIRVNTSASLDVMHKLQKFTFSLSSKGNSIIIRSVRSSGEQFKVVIKTNQHTEKMSLRIPDNIVLYSPMTEMAMKRLNPGEELQISTLNPSTMTPIDIVIRAMRKESLHIGTNTYDTTVLATDYQGMTILSWIDPEGAMIRQETPFGWILERCTPQEAIHALRTADNSIDVLTGMAVPCKGTIRKPRTAKKLLLRLTGVPFSKTELEISPRQSVVSTNNSSIELLMLTSKMEPSPTLPLTDANDLKSYTEASPYIQSTHPALRSSAERITKGLESDAEKAVAIYNWVYKNVTKEMTVSFPSALDVLHNMKGDCNEHTYLFTGLARAAGIPARVTVGLAYHEGAFYYHAWPTVYIGHWVEMDPTWGQQTVDATHIAFVYGEVASQLKIMKILGRLKIEILEESAE